MLLAPGKTGQPSKTLKQLNAGTPYQYDVSAKFDGNGGKGDRMSGRTCTFTFTRR